MSRLLTKVVNTGKATLFIVGGIPDDFFLSLDAKDYISQIVAPILPEGSWLLVGMVELLEEEDAEDLVTLTYDNGGTRDGNGIDKIYLGDERSIDSVGGTFETAKDALMSFIEMECTLNNKIGPKPPQRTDYYGKKGSREFPEDFILWHLQEARVYTNAVIFKKIL